VSEEKDQSKESPPSEEPAQDAKEGGDRPVRKEMRMPKRHDNKGRGGGGGRNDRNGRGDRGDRNGRPHHRGGGDRYQSRDRNDHRDHNRNRDRDRDDYPQQQQYNSHNNEEIPPEALQPQAHTGLPQDSADDAAPTQAPQEFVINLTDEERRELNSKDLKVKPDHRSHGTRREDGNRACRRHAPPRTYF
jgi:hypothetical protein